MEERYDQLETANFKVRDKYDKKKAENLKLVTKLERKRREAEAREELINQLMDESRMLRNQNWGLR